MGTAAASALAEHHPQALTAGHLTAQARLLEQGFGVLELAVDVAEASEVRAAEHALLLASSGVGELGRGLIDVSKGVTDCHLQELADILAKLAAKLGVAPEVAWVEEALKILIDGVEIEQEIGTACVDYSEGNWVGFGYSIAKLVKTLLGDTVALPVMLAALPAP